MPTVAQVMAELKRDYKPDDCIAVAIWSEADIFARAKERDLTITREQAQGILDDMDHNHDAEWGLTWDNVDSALDEIEKPSA